MKEDKEQWKPVQTSHSDVCSPINVVDVSYRDVFETDIQWQLVGMRNAQKSFLQKTMCVQHFNLESSDYYQMQIHACSRK